MKTTRRSFLALLGLAPIASKAIVLQPEKLPLDALPAKAPKEASLVTDAQLFETDHRKEITITLNVFGASKFSLDTLIGPVGSMFTSAQLARFFSFHAWGAQEDRWILLRKSRKAARDADEVTLKFGSFRTNLWHYP